MSQTFVLCIFLQFFKLLHSIDELVEDGFVLLVKNYIDSYKTIALEDAENTLEKLFATIKEECTDESRQDKVLLKID